jgi:single-strand selective monofunctional uracil DNA glycosylase
MGEAIPAQEAESAACNAPQLVVITGCFRNVTLPWSEPEAWSGAVTHVYAPLTYAWAPHEIYLRRYGTGPKRVLFLGMNPGPFGMVQTGIPFGDVPSVRDWLGIEAPVETPTRIDPRRPVWGFACPRREVSGARLWGLFAERFGSPERFFADHFVLNYCPLAFLANGRNLPPDRLPREPRVPLLAMCDAYLREVVKLLRPQWLVGVGNWVTARAQAALAKMASADGSVPQVVTMLHPSPANPAANRGWAKQAVLQLEAAGVW